MAVPYPIANGQVPSGTKLQANLAYLEGLITGGKAINSATYATLRTAAAAAPTVAFLCIATDANLFLLYTGVATTGDGGFITLADFTPIS